ncbi:putative E3 ubiquitin-protein ligase ARI5 [Silene latifolia]|uniref:putative E3 ubiquitin-protein ligase ARI5 n=1 Tax=Silene latifolia TaxID=37657 RepID=UPI003D784A85
MYSEDEEEIYPEDEDIYSEDEDIYSEHEDCYETDSEFDTSDLAADAIFKKSYRILQEADVQELLDNVVGHVSSTLCISEDEAIKVLYHYKWKDSLLLDEWFSNEEKVRENVGLPISHARFSCSGQLTACGICLESFPIDNHHFYPILCGHLYCVMCWKDYLSISIKDGPGCLSLRCPDPACRAAVVGQDMVDKLASDEERKKYVHYLFRSYVEQNKKMKWCPGPGCENAVEFEFGSEGVYNVTCLCSHAFCWNCIEEDHRPVDCDTVVKWTLKNKSQSQNTNWIAANSKPCPKCKRPIQKNQGCMHMTCSKPCLYEFCWLCLEPWSNHGENTGGYYQCNIYNSAKKSGKYDDEEEKRKTAEKTLQKYLHHYERWISNHNSRQRAIDDLSKTKTDLNKLSDKFKITDTELVFMIEAWEQIVECRRVLKWTYAYGFYLQDRLVAKKTLFECLQGQAEACLERLHQCVEEELSVLLKDDEEVKNQEEEDDSRRFFKGNGREELEKKQKVEAEIRGLRPKLSKITSVTRSYFDNLVKALVNDLSEVKPTYKKKANEQAKEKQRFNKDRYYNRNVRSQR